MRIKVLAISCCLVILAVLCIFAGPAYAPTKIAPTEGEPGHPFTIIDTPEGRLVDGCVAVFELQGFPIEIPLRTHKPYKTAQGRLPEDIGAGEYSVSVRCDSTEIVIGMFTVIGDPVPPTPPSISPTSNCVGSSFTITDPQGRIQSGDIAVFYLEGTDPATGTIAANIVISTDGTTLTGEVPGSLGTGLYFVAVRPTMNDDSRFNDLAFSVTLDCPEPYIVPTCGDNRSPFTITDPQGRMLYAGIMVIFEAGLGPDQGTPISDAVFSADGRTATGTIPTTLAGGLHFITVHRTSTADPPLFKALQFSVDSPSGCNPSISPTSGCTALPFTIIDPAGRMGSSTLAIFYREGSDPTAGTLPDDVEVDASGTIMTGTVPPTLAPGQHYVAVRNSLSEQSLFSDLPFLVTLDCPEPSIEPTAGPARTQFTITDPQGRMAGATVIVFFQQDQGPEDGFQVTDAQFSADGTTATGTVPTSLAPSTYFVTVHPGSVTEAPVFNALVFMVSV